MVYFGKGRVMSKMKKNIWIINHYSIDMLVNKGGRHYWMAENLKQHGYNPVVFGCNEKSNSKGSHFQDDILWQEQYSQCGVKYIPIKSSQYTGNGFSRVMNMLMFYFNLLKVAKYYSKRNGTPDIIYASSVHPLTVFAGEKIARHFNVPCIGEVRDLWPETLVAYGAVKKNSLLSKILYLGEKLMYKRADSMIFTMEGAPYYIQEHRWDKGNGGPIDLNKVYHICNGIDIKQFDENAKKYIIDDEELDNPDLFCSVYTGAIKRANNLGLLIDAAELLKDIENFRILVWGEGNEVGMLKEKVCKLGLQGRFIFKGYVEKKYIPSIVSRSDLNLMHWERTSVNNYGYDYNKLFDYLASGRPIFSTIQSGYSLLVNKNCGIETQGLLPKDFADGIRSIFMMTTDERAEWGARAREAAFDYDFSLLTEKLIHIIETTKRA